ncbi:hypothetical protein FHX42_000394 [Saccharopolyspora lacisalsi]|uniref:Uncharacterized protein n=1 Tax=Halosaccharopolyspora lacisalsi TaxID=1000566 RepID=A0A839DUV6_9PSEU|nr:hypothetical protein [Halosaccharopolyspora lacisalsi]
MRPVLGGVVVDGAMVIGVHLSSCFDGIAVTKLEVVGAVSVGIRTA